MDNLRSWMRTRAALRQAKERAAREAGSRRRMGKNLAESVHKTLGDQIEDKKRRQAREAALQERNTTVPALPNVQDREAIENERKRQINDSKGRQRADAARAAAARCSSRPRTRPGHACRVRHGARQVESSATP